MIKEKAVTPYPGNTPFTGTKRVIQGSRLDLYRDAVFQLFTVETSVLGFLVHLTSGELFGTVPMLKNHGKLILLGE